MITYKHRIPWMTNELRKLINNKNKAYSKKWSSAERSTYRVLQKTKITKIPNPR